MYAPNYGGRNVASLWAKSTYNQPFKRLLQVVVLEPVV